MFSRDINHTQYRVPRTLQSSKLGPYARITVLHERTWLRDVAEAIGYAVAGLATGAVISSALYWGYRALGWWLG